MTVGPGKRELYRQEKLPVFQNRMYDSEQDARTCPTGDMVLVEDQATGLIYNAAFDPQLLDYDQHYQNEQALSGDVGSQARAGEPQPRVQGSELCERVVCHGAR